jgi:PKD repeat protein
MKECFTRSRNPLKFFSFWLLITVFLSMVSISSIAQIRSIGSSNILPQKGDQNQYSFTNRPAYPEAGEPVQFTDSSKDQVISWEWDFGDGKTSNVRNPRYSFSKPGFYIVTLTLGSPSGKRRVRRTIGVMPSTDASFSYSPASPKIGQLVQFIDTTSGSPTSWLWRFGDGGTSTAQKPSHSYQAAGLYTVTLVTGTISGSERESRTLTVSAAASAPTLASSFAHSPGSPAPGQVVQFTDTSTGSPTSWQWNFNDASASSVQNPSHAFSNSGSYNVTLVVSNAYGSNSISNNIIVGSGKGSVGTYWVSPTGTATWANAKSATPLSGAACCSLSTANANALAGDTVYLRGGTYGIALAPANSGTAGSRILFQAYGGEVPTFKVNEAGGRWAVKLQGRSYIVIDGITSDGSAAFFYVGYGSCYNEFRNCSFKNSGSAVYSTGIITWLSSAGAQGPGSDHNWFHNCTFSKYGAVTDGNDIGTIRISANGNDPTRNNTFEDCVFSYGGHDCIDIGGQYNVIRNCVFHNEEAYFKDTTGTAENSPNSGYFGNRNILLSNSGLSYPGTAYHTLIEGSRIGHSGTPPDDDGACGIENAGCHTLIRYNYIYNTAGPGIYFKGQPAPSPGVVLKSGSWGRVYNNTIYHAGFGDPDINPGVKDAFLIMGISLAEYYPWPVGVAIKNNIAYDWYDDELDYCTSAEGQITYENNFNANPSFADTDISDPTSLTSPTLALKSDSQCIDAGTYLTQANGSGTNSTTLVVDDALYFQDGTWGSALTHGVTHFPDWIAIGTVDNVVQIASIPLDTPKLGSPATTIILASPVTWADNSRIWLFKNSKGERVLYGTAPNIGAHEFDKR